MSFDKEKENGGVNNSNFYNHSLHQMFSNGSTPFNGSPTTTSPSIGNYAMPMYGTNNANGTPGNNFNQTGLFFVLFFINVFFQVQHLTWLAN